MPQVDKFPSEVEELFGFLRRQIFSAHNDPNRVIHEMDQGSGEVGPSGWTGKHDFHSFIGQQQLFDDPVLESIITHDITTTERRVARDWYAKYVLNSGAAPTTLQITKIARSDKVNNTMDSDVLALQIAGPASASNLTVHFYTKDKISIAATRPNFDWLVDAIRVFRFNSPWDTTNVTTLNVTLELVKNLTGTEVISDTDVLDVLTLDATTIRLLYCGAEQPFTNTDEWDVRIKVDFVTTGSASTDVKVGLFAPQFHWNYARDPIPYAPERFGAYAHGGDGNDGNVTIASGTTTLTRDMYYNRLIVASGATLATAGYRVFVKDYLVNSGTISVNGNPGGNGGNSSSGTGGTAGAAAAATTSGSPTMPVAGGIAGSAGNDGGTPSGKNGVAASNAVAARIGPVAKGGGGGGKGDTTGSNGSAGADTSAPAEPASWRTAVGQTSWVSVADGVADIPSYPDRAGGGGGGGGSLTTHGGGGGGGSGSSGGIVWISAQTSAGSGTYSVTGGAGGNGGRGATGGDVGGGGGGSGGSGGWVIILTRHDIFGGTYSVTGGAGGTGGLGRNNGVDGTDGSTGTTGTSLVFTLDPRQ